MESFTSFRKLSEGEVFSLDGTVLVISSLKEEFLASVVTAYPIYTYEVREASEEERVVYEVMQS